MSNKELIALITKALDSEIEWSEEHGKNQVSDEWRNGFIKGLHHAKLITKLVVEKVNEDKP